MLFCFISILFSFCFLFFVFLFSSVIWFPEFSDKQPLSMPRSAPHYMINNASQAHWARGTCHWRDGIVLIYTIFWNVYLEYTVYWHVQHRPFIRPTNISRCASSIKLSHLIKYCEYLFLVFSSHLIKDLSLNSKCFPALSQSLLTSKLNTRWRYLHLAVFLVRETTYGMSYLIYKGDKARPFLSVISSISKLLWQTSKFQI